MVNNKRFWIIILLAFCVLFIMSCQDEVDSLVDEDSALVGKAGEIREKNVEKKVEIDSKKEVIEKKSLSKDVEDRETGCYLELATETQSGNILGGIEVWFSDSYNDCQSYALSFQFGYREDVLRLIISTPPELRETERLLLQNEIDNLPPKEQIYVIKWKDYAQEDPIKGGPVVTIFQQPLDNEQCDTIDFFGVSLYCYNGVVVPGFGRLKDSNYEYVISSLLFLKLAGTSYDQNILTSDQIAPFDFIEKEEGEFIDGRMLLSLNTPYFTPDEIIYIHDTPNNIGLLLLKDVKCHEEETEDRPYGVANFQFRSQNLLTLLSLPLSLQLNPNPYTTNYLQYFIQQSNPRFVTFTCESDTGPDRRITNAYVFTHEILHKFSGPHPCQREGDDNPHHDYILESPYGAQAYYEFYASQNTILTCYERTYLYQSALNNFEKLCGEVSHNFLEPDCELVVSETGDTDKREIEIIEINYD